MSLSEVLCAARLEPIEVHHHSAFTSSVTFTLKGFYQLNAVTYNNFLPNKISWLVLPSSSFSIAALFFDYLFYRSPVFGTPVLFSNVTEALHTRHLPS